MLDKGPLLKPDLYAVTRPFLSRFKNEPTTVPSFHQKGFFFSRRNQSGRYLQGTEFLFLKEYGVVFFLDRSPFFSEPLRGKK